ncbi:MAG: RHS repeat-associated core domain-containing protein [Clostridium sp.]|nr:RHS repeat-associated core domain-containing protein [Bacteroides sp.]MCM1199165.1 RHS repeat-associated core domain-containing protein [Clostridium sp.]
MDRGIWQFYLAADRNASYNYARTGILTRIQYPTGGYTDFEYEFNEFENHDNAYYGGDFKYAYDYYDSYVSESSLLEQEFTVKEKLPSSSYAIVYYNGFKCTGSSSHPVIDYTYEDFTKDDVIFRLEKKDSSGGWYTVNYKTFENILCSEINSRGEARIAIGNAFEPGDYRLVMPTYMNTKAGINLVIPHVKGFDEYKGGGLRARSIKDYDGTRFRETQYRYAHGLAHDFPRTIYLPKNLQIESYGQYTSNVFSLGANMSGISVAYDMVEEVHVDNDSTVCFSRYTFHNRSENFPSLASAPGTPSKCFIENGLPKAVEIYDGNGRLQQSTVYNYVQDKSLREAVDGLHIVSLHSPFNQMTCLYNFYEYPSEWWYLDSETTTDYFENGANVQSTAYVYDKEHRVVIEEVTEYNDGTVEKDDISYLYREIPDSLSYTVELPERRSRYVDSIFAWSELMDYGSGIDLETYSTRGPGQTGYEERFSVEAYDSYHNPVYLVKNNTEHIVYIWGYNGIYPVAGITGATLDDVLSALGHPGDTDYMSVLASAMEPDAVLLKSLQQKLPDAHVNLFSYKLLTGIDAATDAAGKTSRYEYDSTGRLICIEDNQGNPVQSFGYSYFFQGDGRNYIRTRTYTEGRGQEYFDDIVYYDGLGKGLQQNMVYASPSGKDLVSMTGYDVLGRKWREWLPVPLAVSGQYIDADDFECQSKGISGYGDNYPYTEHIYGNSMLDRLKQERGAGEAFQVPEAFLSISYLMNGSSVALSCLDFSLMDNGSGIICSGEAPVSTYRVTCSVGPDSSVIYEFKDRHDRTILARQKVGGLYADTYYIYDSNSNLRYVLPPGLSRNIPGACRLEQTDALMDRYAYMYGYDDRNRCIRKKTPGAGWVYYGYDVADRLILSQDASLRDDGKWMISLPDVFGRPVLQGIVEGNDIHRAMFVDKSAFVEFDGQATDSYCLGTSCGLDLGRISVLQVNYYDDYRFMYALPDLFVGLGYRQEAGYAVPYNTGDDMLKSKGLPTGSLMKEISDGPDAMYASVVFYDRFDRPVQTHRTNHAGGVSSLFTAYDFVGNIVSSKEINGVHGMEHSLVSEMSYDNRGRLMEESSALDLSSVSRMSYGYDEFGRMDAMDYGDGTVDTDIGYNIRGWVTAMDSDVFSMELRYDSPLYSYPEYSGNIAEAEWKSGTDTASTYAYDYDELFRVLGARRYFNGSETDSFTEKEISYDLDGNILSLQRTGNGGMTNDLKYTYSGGMLSSVEDNGHVGQYRYDLNGNMAFDGLRGLELVYNVLDLTESVSDTSGVLVKYSWLPDGTKLSALDSAGNGLLYVGSMVFAKQDGSVSLEGAAFSGGRFMAADSFGGNGISADSFVPYYHVVDHLGSVRAIVDGNGGTVVERDDYYPFGMRWSSSWPAVSANRYRFNGKESQFLFGTPYLDYGARQYDPSIARWNAPDPLAEKYYSVSPYAFCCGNPVNFVDPDGEKVIISGELANSALSQLQAKVGKRISLSIDSQGNLSYTNTRRSVPQRSKKLTDIIDDNKVTVNLKTTSGMETSTGKLMVGGAFMGNTVLQDKDGTTSVVANQEINPVVLGTADNHTGTPGTLVMHELTEAYQGAIISMNTGVSSPDASQKGSVYQQAHDNATVQTPIFQRMIDATGNETKEIKKTVKVEWFVVNRLGIEKTIQILK